MSRRYDAPHPLFGCQIKLDRAYHHTETLNRAAEGFLWRKPHEVAPEIHSEKPEYLAVMHVRDTPPLWWSAVIGDAVHNLRSALDHLAYQLVIANGKKPGGKTAFPIFSSDPFAPDASKKSLETWQGMTKGIHLDDIATIKIAQPYQRRDATSPSHLLNLNRLSNRDKHRDMHLTASVLVESHFEFEAVENVELGPTEFGHYGPFEDRTIVAVSRILRIPDETAKSKVNMKGQLAYGVAFSDGAPSEIKGMEITGTLRWIGNRVHDVIHEFGMVSPRFKQD